MGHTHDSKTDSVGVHLNPHPLGATRGLTASFNEPGGKTGCHRIDHLVDWLAYLKVVGVNLLKGPQVTSPEEQAF